MGLLCQVRTGVLNVAGCVCNNRSELVVQSKWYLVIRARHNSVAPVCCSMVLQLVIFLMCMLRRAVRSEVGSSSGSAR